MRNVVAVLITVTLAGCGVETATTAASGSVARKQELEQATRTTDQVRQKVGAAMELSHERTERAEAAAR